MNYFIFVSLLLVTWVNCRPQDLKKDPAVEIEKQTIFRLPNTNERSRQPTNEDDKTREATTKEILDKIAQVNQGLAPKTVKRPFYSFSTHQQKQQNMESKAKQLPNFQFSNTPLGNPIFDYLQRNPNKIATKQVTISSDDDDDIPEGYAIKRKVTHQQTLIVPNYPPMPDPYFNPMFSSLPVQNQFEPTRGGQYGLVPISPFGSLPGTEKSKNTTHQNKTLDELTLAKQNYLINNIKNIVSSSQGSPNYYYPNPYLSPVQMNPYQYSPYNYDPYASLRISPFNSLQNYIPTAAQLPVQNSDSKFSDTYYANLQTVKDSSKSLSSNQNQDITPTGRQMTPPFSQYFPIVIKNPFQQMFQAFTSMIEYGPDSNLCRRHGNNKHNHETDEEHIRSRIGKALKDDENKDIDGEQKLEADTEERSLAGTDVEETRDIVLEDKESKTEIVIKKLEETSATKNDNDFYIEGLNISGKPAETTKQETREMGEDNEPETFIEEDKFFSHHHQKYPTNDPPPIASGFPGNGGIFIQKLKVRKGGVAIAGPGGIATAGSGGTAIVGPNGYAYTQPDGVAIAGPGTRVISVDPGVDLGEFVQNMKKNKTLARFGKVVAVGPVVYHDLGQN